MIELPILLGFVIASALLIASPGPNVAFIALHSALYGKRIGLLIALGLTCGQAAQIFLILAGFSALLSAWVWAFSALKLLGAIYLFWLAFETFRSLRQKPAAIKSQATLPAENLFRRALLVALSNPKTLLFHAAFLPQFVSPQSAALPQLLLLAMVFLIIAFCLDGLWAIGIGSLRGFLQNSRVQSLLKWGTGFVYFLMGVLVFTKKALKFNQV